MASFFLTLRSSHPLAVFSDMEAIMTMVLQEIHECEEFPLELLKIILSSVRKENQVIIFFNSLLLLLVYSFE